MRQKQIKHNQILRTYCNFDGQSIIDLISTLKVWIEESSQRGFDNLRLVQDYSVNRGYYNLIGDRMETEDEHEMRVKHEEAAAKKHKMLKEKNKLKTEERERKEYERLKIKFTN